MRVINVTNKDVGSELRNFFSTPKGTTEVINRDDVFFVDQLGINKPLEEQTFRIYTEKRILCENMNIDNMSRFIDSSDGKNALIWRVTRLIRSKIYEDGRDSIFVPDICAEPGYGLNVSVISYENSDDMDLCFDVSYEDMYGLSRTTFNLKCPYDSKEFQWVNILRKIII